MKKFAESMSKSFGAGPGFDFGSLGGVPVYIKQDHEDTGQVLEGVTHTGIGADLFQIPGGYHEQTMNVGD